jgi:murein DD-endopeptidase MepM/ murein hydrolase activator NlpD
MNTSSFIKVSATPEDRASLAQSDAATMAKRIETVFLTEFLKAMFEQTSFAKNKTISTFMPVITGHIADALSDRGLGFSELMLKNKKIGQDLPPASTGESVQSVKKGAVQYPAGKISSNYGKRIDPFTGQQRQHKGIDIAVPQNTPVQPTTSGKVIFSGFLKGYGNCVILDHGSGITSLYGHNTKNLVKAGDIVEAGTTIALSGATGRATGPHIHFEVRRHGVPINPSHVDLKVG